MRTHLVGDCKKAIVETDARFALSGPLTCNPRYILSTLLYRKAVENKDYQHVTIPNPRDIERITSNLNEQVMALLENAFFSDSMIADRLLQRQRTEVEDGRVWQA